MNNLAQRVLGKFPGLKRAFSDRSRLEAEITELRAELHRYQRGWPPGHFYSPIPAREEVKQREAQIFDVTAREIPGIALNEAQQLDLLDRLGGYYREQPFTAHQQTQHRYFFENDYYTHGDAMILYCLIRYLRPRKIIEVGSGFSSCVILDTNELFFDGAIAHTVIDPYPQQLEALMRGGDENKVEVIRRPLQDVDVRRFSDLSAGDILFIDSTHVSKVNSDVNHIFFKVLPSLTSGSYIHFHDIYYPFEYPKEWIYAGRAWNEAYLLRAFLQYNACFKIRLFNSFLANFHRDRLASQMPLFLRSAASSIWIEKTASEAYELSQRHSGRVMAGQPGLSLTVPKTHVSPSLPISVVVCSRDRAQWLECCLESLRKLDYENYEVVVVDNASRDDATARVVAATPFRYVREERPGLDWARNRGAAEAQHDIIAYIDDDAQADPGWLRGIAAAFADASVSAVTGLVRPAELDTPAQRLFEQYGGMGKGLNVLSFHGAAMRPHNLIASHAVGVGANMAFRCSVFATVGGFDTALDVGTPACGGGDLDMFHRVLTAGLTLRYEPSALVWHQHRRDLDGLWRQLYNNGRSFGVYLIKLWLAGSIERREVARFAAGWFVAWVLARFVRGLVRAEHFPLSLLWAELWGALHAPWAYVVTYRNDAHIRRSTVKPPHRPVASSVQG